MVRIGTQPDDNVINFDQIDRVNLKLDEAFKLSNNSRERLTHKERLKLNKPEKRYKESGVKLLDLPKRRLMSAFIGRSSKNINSKYATSSHAINELDCLMEVDMVI